MDSLAIVAFVLACSGVIYTILRRSRPSSNVKGLPLPPGPPSMPLLGNLLDMPGDETLWIQAAKWAEQYGDVVHVKVLGQPVIFLNTEEAATDLLEKRSSVHSDRVKTVMINELVGGDWTLAARGYGDRWRTARRMLHEMFTVKGVQKYRENQVKYTRIMLKKLLAHPDDFYEHAKHFVSGVIMDIIYGVDIGPYQTNLAHMAEKAMDALNAASQPVSFIVDSFPFLKHLPSWSIGAGFKRKARVWKKQVSDTRVIPFQATIDAEKESNGRFCFVSSWLNKIEATEDTNQNDFLMECLKDAAGSAFLGGTDTVASSIQTLFIAMMLYPDAQAKAQEELDRVVGRDRLPDESDDGQLRYVKALSWEIFRWRSVAPMAAPHKSIADDEYRGMFIPKGSLLLPNVWLMLRSNYGPDPEEFRPERFLKEGGIRDPTDVAFGFGRRICPGRHLAESAIFITVSSILHLFKITPPVDDAGNPLPVQENWTRGISIRPKPFPTSVTRRFPEVQELLANLEL